MNAAVACPPACADSNTLPAPPKNQDAAHRQPRKRAASKPRFPQLPLVSTTALASSPTDFLRDTLRPRPLAATPAGSADAQADVHLEDLSLRSESQRRRGRPRRNRIRNDDRKVALLRDRLLMTKDANAVLADAGRALAGQVLTLRTTAAAAPPPDAAPAGPVSTVSYATLPAPRAPDTLLSARWNLMLSTTKLMSTEALLQYRRGLVEGPPVL